MEKKEKFLKKHISKFLGHDSFELERLKGDGSERSLFRILDQDKKDLIAVFHEDITENLDFIKITKLLQENEIPVPLIYYKFPDDLGYILEDLGSTNLAEKMLEIPQANLNLFLKTNYTKTIDHLIKIQSIKDPTLDKITFETDIQYFKHNFLHRFQFLDIKFHQLQRDLDALLHKINFLDFETILLRDFQSRNIMWKDGALFFIDYQNAMIGPTHYDLASLLYASKSGLNEEQRKDLIEYYYEKNRCAESIEIFEEELYWIVLIRRLRSLGSYAYLSLEKQKKAFFKSLSPSIDEILFLLKTKGKLNQFHFLLQTFEEIKKQWEDIQSHLIKSI